MANEFRFCDLEKNFPPFIPRVQIQQFFPWLSPKRMANLDCTGAGPANLVKNGRAVVYPTKSLLAWLDTRNQQGGKNESFNKNISIVEEDLDGEVKISVGVTPKTYRRGRKRKIDEVRERRGLK